MCSQSASDRCRLSVFLSVCEIYVKFPLLAVVVIARVNLCSREKPIKKQTEKPENVIIHVRGWNDVNYMISYLLLAVCGKELHVFSCCLN